MHTDDTPDALPFSVRTGSKEEAAHRPVPDNLWYANNPLITSLPRILDPNDAINVLTRDPSLPKQLDQNPAMRMHALEATLQAWYQATSGTVELDHAIGVQIRAGYQARNPFLSQYDATREHDLQQLRNSFGAPRSRSTSLTTRFIGASGMGKTTAIETILSRYPQVIYHRELQGQSKSFTQLVWVHMDCPFDGSPRGLCLNFLATVDEILGTKYYKSYSTGRQNTDELLMSMARVVRNHALGILVMDEVQVLRDLKSESATKLLNFFVQLANRLGVPIMSVGTCRASKLYGKAFRQARRGTGQGALTWLPYPKDHSDWNGLFASLSRYQVMDVPVTNPNVLEKLRNVLHKESAGIVDIAVKLWKFAQWRGLTCKHTSLSTKLITSVAKDSLGEVRDLLRAFQLKRVNVEGLEDIQIINEDALLTSTKSPDIETLLRTLVGMVQSQQQSGANGGAARGSGEQAEPGSTSDTQHTGIEPPSGSPAPPSLPGVELTGPLLKDIAAEAARNGQSEIHGFRDRGLVPLSEEGACA